MDGLGGFMFGEVRQRKTFVCYHLRVESRKQSTTACAKSSRLTDAVAASEVGGGTGQGWVLLPSRFSHVRLCATPQTAAQQAPLSLGFSRQEYWSGLPFPSPEDQTCVSYVFCIGRWILYYSLHLLCTRVLPLLTFSSCSHESCCCC